jgi:hypothetical protein
MGAADESLPSDNLHGIDRLVPLDKEATADLATNGDVSTNYEPFCTLSYAVDSALPIVSLGQREKMACRFSR